MRWMLSFALVAVACKPEGAAEDEIVGPSPAPLTEVSGTCPDLTTPGIKTFTSAGVERRAGVYFPSAPKPGMPVMFAWHGLTTPEMLPLEGLVAGFALDRLAEDEGVVVVVPEANGIDLFGQFVLLWGILGNEHEAQDLTMFDDLRTCVADSLDVDLRRVTSWGHSGGGLWTSMLLMDRSESLATGLSSSGGVGLSIPLLGDRLSYRTPARKLPAMMVSGGPTDVWPDAILPIIEFERTTDTLEQRLAADGHFVVRCHHELGHNYLPDWFWRQTTRWLLGHEYGVPSPWETGERSVHSDCAVVSREG